MASGKNSLLSSCRGLAGGSLLVGLRLSVVLVLAGLVRDGVTGGLETVEKELAGAQNTDQSK